MKKILKIGCLSGLGLFGILLVIGLLVPDKTPSPQKTTSSVLTPVAVPSEPAEVPPPKSEFDVPGESIEAPPKSEFEIMMSQAAHSIHATQLAQEYSDNEFAADEKYKGQIVLIRGNITHFSEVFGSAVVQLEGGLLTNIVCDMQKSQKPLLAQLKKGQDVLIVGKVTGKSLGIGVDRCLVGLPGK